MDTNRLNYAQKSNFIAGCSEIFKYEFYIQEFNIPGLSVNTVETYNQGLKHLVTGDGITHTELSLSVMLDEDFLVYQALKKWLEDSVNQTSGSFADRSFTFYCDVHNNKGNYLFTVMFYECKILSLSDVQMSASDDSASNIVSVSVEYDWFEIKKSGLPEDWKKAFNIVEIKDNTGDDDNGDGDEDEDEDICEIHDDDNELDGVLEGDEILSSACECNDCDCGCGCDCTVGKDDCCECKNTAARHTGRCL